MEPGIITDFGAQFDTGISHYAIIYWQRAFENLIRAVEYFLVHGTLIICRGWMQWGKGHWRWLNVEVMLLGRVHSFSFNCAKQYGPTSHSTTASDHFALHTLEGLSAHGPLRNRGQILFPICNSDTRTFWSRKDIVSMHWGSHLINDVPNVPI